ncbi:MAG: FAD-binding oxidoreductase [Rhodospirillales bacterium]
MAGWLMSDSVAFPGLGQKPHVTVVGAGIVGVCCAINLIREGFSVTIIDKEGVASGASSGNAGAISPGSCIPLSEPGGFKKVPKWLFHQDGPLVIQPTYALQVLPWLIRFLKAGTRKQFEHASTALHRLHSLTYECYRPILKFANAEHLIRKTGALTAYETAAAFESSKSGWALRASHGVTYEVLDSADIRELVPALGEGIRHAVLQPDHGYVIDPHTLVTTLFEAACRNGANYQPGNIVGIGEHNGHICVKFESGETLHSNYVVVAAGAASAELLKTIQLKVPLERQRGYHLHLPDAQIQLPLPVSFAIGKFYATPMQTGVRLAGTVEFARKSAPPNYARADALARLASRWLPGLKTEGASRWMGNRPCTPDSLPVIGAAPQNPKILFAFGHGHNGMTSASTTSRIIADLAANRPPCVDISPYQIDRFL